MSYVAEVGVPAVLECGLARPHDGPQLEVVRVEAPHLGTHDRSKGNMHSSGTEGKKAACIDQEEGGSRVHLQLPMTCDPSGLVYMWTLHSTFKYSGLFYSGKVTT